MRRTGKQKTKKIAVIVAFGLLLVLMVLFVIPTVDILKCTNGEWMVYAYEPSDRPLWGGRIVTMDSRGEIRSFYGEIDVVLWSTEKNSLDDAYSHLLSWFGTSPADYDRKKRERAQKDREYELRRSGNQKEPI